VLARTYPRAKRGAVIFTHFFGGNKDLKSRKGLKQVIVTKVSHPPKKNYHLT